MSDSPIFIIGFPRSGTTLLAAMLSTHSRMACGPETQFFRKLTPKMAQKVVYDKQWPNEAIKFITSLTLNGERVYKLFNISIQEIEFYLKDSPPSVAVMLESLTKLYAIKNNKIRWIEKTPGHLMYINKIKKYFPDSKVITQVSDLI